MPAPNLRAIFDEDPEGYHRTRPGYPDELFDDLAQLTELGRGCRVAEVGPGTGQATAALVGHGADVVAVEIGPGLASVLQRRLGAGTVEVVVSAFEDWVLPEQTFDLVTAFTAWHWLERSVRAPKVADALRPGGALATVSTVHVRDGSEEFFARAQECYQRWDPTTRPGLVLPSVDEVPPAVDEVDDSDLFQPAVRRRYEQELAYTAEAYVELLTTYSGHRALEPPQRTGLLSCLADLINEDFDGSITKRYLYELRVARRSER